MKRLILLIVIIFMGLNTQAHTIPQPQEDEIYDTLLDCVFIGMDIGELIVSGGTSGWVSLGADLGCLVTPGATGSGHAIRIGKRIAKGSTQAKKVGKIRFSKYIKQLDNIKITKSFIYDNMKHAFQKHCKGRAYSYFYGVKNKQQFIKLIEEALSQVGNKSSQVFVRPNGAVSIAVCMSKEIGKTPMKAGQLPSIGTNIIMMHFNPNAGPGKHKFSAYPVGLTYLANFRGLK
jgi:hypothetical protein